MPIVKIMPMRNQTPPPVGLFRSQPGRARSAFKCAAMFAVVLLSGCATQGGAPEDRVGSLMVSPGKYQFYPCANLAAQTVSLKARERELEALIAKAGPGAGGSLVSAVSYRPEYLQVRGNLAEVRKAEAAKNCPPPGAAPPAPAIGSKPKKR